MYDKAKADRVMAFMRLLKDPKGGQINARPYINWLPWQEEFFRKLFGTVNEDGTRQYREAFVFVPRKNGKSTMIASAVLRQLFQDGEFGQEIYSAANDRDQAGLVFSMACSMINADPVLKKNCKIYESSKRIVRTTTESFYRAISREAATAHGFNPSFVIYDELHEAKNRDLYDVLKTGQGARKSPLFCTITTAGTDVNSICYELYSYARNVRDGIVDDPTFLPVLYEAPADADIWDETTWHIANPSLGAFRNIDEIRQLATRAKALPSLEVAFRRLYLNQWVQSDARWMRREIWARAKQDIPDSELLGQPCYAGLDLASNDDFSALVLVFPRQGGYVVRPFFWIPEANAYKTRKSNVRLEKWIRQGLIEVTPGEVTDYSFILERIRNLNQIYQIREIAFDRWGSASLQQAIIDTGIPLVTFGQGFASMSPPMREAERVITSGELSHDGNEVLSWMMDNVVAITDPAGNIKPDKNKSADKIDGVVAMLMGFDRATKAGANISPIVYQTDFCLI